MRVDIWSDVVCPWCYIGNSRFSRALADFEHRGEVEVVYRSFELDPSILVGLAAEEGLDPGRARQALEDGSYADAVRADEDQARVLGITGVPFCVVDAKYGVSGAQPAQTFTRALWQAWEAR